MSVLEQAAVELEEAFADRTAWGVEVGSGNTIHISLGDYIQQEDLELVRAAVAGVGYEVRHWRIDIIDGALYWHISAWP